jgi:hypothetical protein
VSESGATPSFSALPHPFTIPVAIATAAPVLWPLQRIELFERMLHPVSATFGAPLKVIDTFEAALPASSVRMHASPDAAIPFSALADTVIGILGTPRVDLTAVGTSALACPT